MNTLTLNSYAKVNLYLSVLNQRKDGYHNLKTLFERIDLADKITLKSRPDKKITLTCNIKTLPRGNANLAWQAAKLLRDKFNTGKGVDIKIIKRIPVGSGMGGGSSNAASVLMGLNKLWGLKLPKTKLSELGAKLGCDVPFFVYNTPFALGEGRGDKIKPLKGLDRVKFWHIIAVPKIKVSTPLIYKKWDEYLKTFKLTPLSRCGILHKNTCVAALTIPRYNVNILTSALSKKDLSLVSGALFNSLEQVTLKLYPLITAVKEKLIRMGVRPILMSGSGPTVFGVVSSRKEALSLSRQLKTNSSSVQVFVSRTR